jgi:hypothetical protein
MPVSLDDICVFDGQIKFAVNRLLHSNADSMCSQIRGLSLRCDVALNADADPMCVFNVRSCSRARQ